MILDELRQIARGPLAGITLRRTEPVSLRRWPQHAWRWELNGGSAGPRCEAFFPRRQRYRSWATLVHTTASGRRNALGSTSTPPQGCQQQLPDGPSGGGKVGRVRGPGLPQAAEGQLLDTP